MDAKWLGTFVQRTDRTKEVKLTLPIAGETLEDLSRQINDFVLLKEDEGLVLKENALTEFNHVLHKERKSTDVSPRPSYVPILR